jgi:2Fe-2S ferredoxin
VAVIITTDRNGAIHHVDAWPGRSIMELLRAEGLPIEALCGGQGACATCHCYIDAAWRSRLPPPTQDELDLLAILETRNDASRLTCQLQFTADLDGLTLTIAPEG